MTCWDTSAILKLYVAEQDSGYFERLLAESDEAVFSSVIANTEVLCALHRKEQAGDLKAGGAKAVFRKFCADCEVGKILTIPYGRDVATEAEGLVRIAFSQPRPIVVRALDVIHVASALAAGARMLVATDMRLRQLATLARLRLLP